MEELILMCGFLMEHKWICLYIRLCVCGGGRKNSTRQTQRAVNNIDLRAHTHTIALDI